MNTSPPLPLWMSARRAVLGVAGSAVLGIASVATYADPSAASAASSRVADVSLADLNLSTPEGMSAARERLQTMAEKLCGGSLTPLLTHLVHSQKLTAAEREELRNLIEELDESPGKGKGKNERRR